MEADEQGWDPAQRVAFRLAQVGGYAAMRFAERLTELGLQPSDVGLLRLIAADPGQSQQTLAGSLGVAPSRVVALVDELQRKDLVTRERSPRDRRNHELRLTPTAEAVLARMRDIGAAHEKDIVRALSREERATLAALLGKVAASHDLTPDVHPGFRAASR